jgi:hypothetical protein
MRDRSLLFDDKDMSNGFDTMSELNSVRDRERLNRERDQYVGRNAAVGRLGYDPNVVADDAINFDQYFGW